MEQRKFELVAPYQPSGDQPEAIEGLVQGVADGLRTQVLLGVAALTGALALIHALILPRPVADVPAGTEKSSLVSDFFDTWKTFFKK